MQTQALSGAVAFGPASCIFSRFASCLWVLFWASFSSDALLVLPSDLVPLPSSGDSGSHGSLALVSGRQGLREGGPGDASLCLSARTHSRASSLYCAPQTRAAGGGPFLSVSARADDTHVSSCSPRGQNLPAGPSLCAWPTRHLVGLLGGDDEGQVSLSTVPSRGGPVASAEQSSGQRHGELLFSCPLASAAACVAGSFPLGCRGASPVSAAAAHSRDSSSASRNVTFPSVCLSLRGFSQRCTLLRWLLRAQVGGGWVWPVGWQFADGRPDHRRSTTSNKDTCAQQLTDHVNAQSVFF